MHSKSLEGFKRAVESENLGVYGLHLHVDGQVPASCQFREDERVHLYSGSKTFTSLAIGIAEAEGLLTLDRRVLDFFPQYGDLAIAGSDAITVKDLLHMCAGHMGSLFSTDEATHNLTTDWAELFFTRTMQWPAGTHFHYDNGCTYMLSRIIEATSGETLRDYLTPRLFSPLGIHNPQWHTCPAGHSLGAIGLYLKTEEFARLGILLLHGGIWEGARLVPQAYLRQATHDLAMVHGFDDPENNCGYGYQLWRCTIPGAYRADGKFGQYSIVLPEQHAVIAVTAHNERRANDILRAVWREVVTNI